MKKNFLTLSIIASVFSYAQNAQNAQNQDAIKGRVGINTTTPRATLDIVAKNYDNNPGVIVPNITIPTTVKDKKIINQFEKLEKKVVDGKTKDFAESTLIYVKGENFKNKRINIDPDSKTEEVSQKGFYYYDGKDWLPLRPKTQMYLPSIVLETELPPKEDTKPYTYEEADKKVYCVNLYNVYQGQFKNITNDNKTADSSDNKLNNGCGSNATDATKTISIKDKTYRASSDRKLEVIGSGGFDYYVTYYDPDIFKDVKIENRTLKYKIIRNETDPTKTKNNITEKTFISILLREK